MRMKVQGRLMEVRFIEIYQVFPKKGRLQQNRTQANPTNSQKSRHPEQVYNTPRQSIHAMQGENTD